MSFRNFVTTELSLLQSNLIRTYTNSPPLTLVVLVPILYYAFHQVRTTRHRARATHAMARVERAVQASADASFFKQYVWSTPRWIVLAGLSELYMLGALPFGFWGDAEGASLRAGWRRERRFLRGLLRMGVVPLYITEGGIGTREVEGEGGEGKGYVQRKERASFAFLVPLGGGYSASPNARGARADGSDEDEEREKFVDFVNLVRGNREGYRVCVTWEQNPRHVSDPPPDAAQPLEVGAKSQSEFYLPFKPDTVLKRGKGPVEDDFRELTTRPRPSLLDIGERQRPVVRVEAPHYKSVRLDEWVWEKAREAGLEEIWDPEEMRSRTVRWCRHLGLKVPRNLRPPPRAT